MAKLDLQGLIIDTNLMICSGSTDMLAAKDDMASFLKIQLLGKT